jgi:hypothetical protein
MSKFAIGLLTLAMYAASLPVIAMITPAQAATKKHWRPHVSEPWYETIVHYGGTVLLSISIY